MKRTTHVYRVPKVFTQDHWDRDLGWSDRIVHETKQHYFVRMTDAWASDLQSDADYYFDPYGPDMYPGFKMAAKACLKAMNDQLEEVRQTGRTRYDERFAPGCYPEVSNA